MFIGMALLLCLMGTCVHMMDNTAPSATGYLAIVLCLVRIAEILTAIHNKQKEK